MVNEITTPRHITNRKPRFKVMQLEKGIFSVMDIQNPVDEPWNPVMQYDDRESADGYAAQCEFHWQAGLTAPIGKRWAYINGKGGYAWVD